MRPSRPRSRRATLGLVGATLAAPLPGCVAPGTANAGTDENGEGGESKDAGPAPSEGAPALEVRLTGPDSDRRLFDAGDVARVGSVRDARTGGFALPVTLTDKATAAATETAREVGLADAPDEFEVVQTHGGEVTGQFEITPALAEAVTDGDWEGEFLLLFERRERAVELQEALANSTAA